MACGGSHDQSATLAHHDLSDLQSSRIQYPQKPLPSHNMDHLYDPLADFLVSPVEPIPTRVTSQKDRGSCEKA